jgi:hypothetical protein
MEASMADVPDMVRFLERCIAEDEAKAHAASPGPWEPKSLHDIHYGDYGWSFGTTVTEHGGELMRAETPGSEQGKTDSVFVGTFDPAWVLAACTVKRAALEAMDVAQDFGSEAWVLVRDLIVKPVLAGYRDRTGFDERWM